MITSWIAIGISTLGLGLSTRTSLRDRISLKVTLSQQHEAHPDGTWRDIARLSVTNHGRVVSVRAVSFELVDHPGLYGLGWTPAYPAQPKAGEDYNEIVMNWIISQSRTIPQGGTEVWVECLSVSDEDTARQRQCVRAKVELSTGKVVISNEQPIRVAWAVPGGHQWIGD